MASCTIFVKLILMKNNGQIRYLYYTISDFLVEGFMTFDYLAKNFTIFWLLV